MSSKKLTSIIEYSSSSEEEDGNNYENEEFTELDTELLEEGVNSLSNILKLQERYRQTHEKLEFPIKSNVEFRGSSLDCRRKHITSVSLPERGQKMICGTLNGNIEIYEFNNMYYNDLTPNKVICPLEDHKVQSVEFTEQGNLFLAVCGDPICRLFDGNGNFITGTVRGDPYVKSIKKNYGHTHMVLDCKWDLRNQNCFITSSIDNTIRIFDINSEPYGIDGYLPSFGVMKCSKKTNKDIFSMQVNSIDISSFGEHIAASCTDGSIQVFSRNGNYFSETPTHIIKDAHNSEFGTKSISDLTFINYQLLENRYIASRGILDNSVKVWDLRKINNAINIVRNLPSDNNDFSKLVRSKSGNALLTSTSFLEKYNNNQFIKSSLVFMEINDLVNNQNCNVESIITLNNGISTFEWSYEINQIIVALNNGSVVIYYDKDLSKDPSNKGILLSLNRKRKDKCEGFYDASFQAYNIEELPEGFKETKSGEIKYVGVSSKKSKNYAPKNSKMNY